MKNPRVELCRIRVDSLPLAGAVDVLAELEQLERLVMRVRQAIRQGRRQSYVSAQLSRLRDVVEDVENVFDHVRGDTWRLSLTQEGDQMIEGYVDDDE